MYVSRFYLGLGVTARVQVALSLRISRLALYDPWPFGISALSGSWLRLPRKASSAYWYHSPPSDLAIHNCSNIATSHNGRRYTRFIPTPIPWSTTWWDCPSTTRTNTEQSLRSLQRSSSICKCPSRWIRTEYRWRAKGNTELDGSD